MDYPKLIVSDQKEESISIKRIRIYKAMKENILRDFKNAPFCILCLFHMIDLRMFYFIIFYSLAKWTMICHDFDLLMLFILT